jgi:hypothetical protein
LTISLSFGRRPIRQPVSTWQSTLSIVTRWRYRESHTYSSGQNERALTKFVSRCEKFLCSKLHRYFLSSRRTKHVGSVAQETCIHFGIPRHKVCSVQQWNIRSAVFVSKLATALELKLVIFSPIEVFLLNPISCDVRLSIGCPSYMHDFRMLFWSCSSYLYFFTIIIFI